MQIISFCIPVLPYSDEIKKITDECIGRLTKYTYYPHEICLAVNGGEYVHPSLNVNSKHFPEAIGNPSGWNEAYKLATGDIICFMDNDIWVTMDWLKPILECLKDPLNGIVMPDVYRKDPNGEFHSVNDNKQGCCFFIRRQTLDLLANTENPTIDRVVGFDSRFDPAYCEDTDLFLRVKLHGFRRVVAEGSIVKHLSGATTQKVFKDYEAVAKVSRDKFQEKWAHLGKDGDQYKCWRMWE